MFLNILVDTILLTIIVGGSYYGYREGAFNIALKPVKVVIQIGASIMLCVPFGRTFLSRLVSAAITGRCPEVFFTLCVDILSTVLGFAVVFIITSVLISIISKVFDSCLCIGIIGKFNSLIGLLLAGVISFIAAWGFTALTDGVIAFGLLDESDMLCDFNGGPIYNFFKHVFGRRFDLTSIFTMSQVRRNGN